MNTISRLSSRILPVVFTAAAVLSAFLLAGCGKAASIGSAFITGDNGNIAPDEHRLYFADDAEPVICKVTLAGVTDPVELSSHWYYIKRRTIVYDTDQKIDKDGEITLRLNRTIGDSEMGDYRIDLALNGEPASALYFRIAETLPPPISEEDKKKLFRYLYNIEDQKELPAPPVLSAFNTAKSVYGLTQAPKEIADTFPANAEVIFLTMLMSNAPEDTRVRVEWYYLGDGTAEPKLVIPAELSTLGTRNLAFSFKPGTGDLPTGKYEARVVLNGEEFSNVPFTVTPSGESSTANEPARKDSPASGAGTPAKPGK